MNIVKPHSLNFSTNIPNLTQKQTQTGFKIGKEDYDHQFNLLPIKMETQGLSIYYEKFQALKNVSMSIPENKITALIGPSGCGKSTLLRSFNRMNDLIQGSRIEGEVLLNGKNIYDPDMDVVDIRQRIGMVFQRPNPFPMSVFDNVAYGPRLYGIHKKSILEDIVEHSLRQAAVWNDVKNKLDQSGLELSGGQQQRLCIARALAVEPTVILMDEPASALDPISTLKIEELMETLKNEYTIVIVTHNMQQAARVSDFTAFLMIDKEHAGILVEYGTTQQVFTNPQNKQTEAYVTGRFG